MVAEAEFRVSSKFSSSAFLPSESQICQNNATATRGSTGVYPSCPRSSRFLSAAGSHPPIQDPFSSFPSCVLHASACHKKLFFTA